MATKNTKIPSKAMQKRIMKSGEVSDADVELYIKQVGIDTLQSMSLAPENIKEYLKNITELGNPQSKKKLPSKKKIQSSDSVLVVDGNDTISKVASKDADLSIKSLSKKAGEGALDLGSAAFNKMFPNVGKFMTWAQNKLAKQDKNAAESNSSIQGYSREVSKSSSMLDNIIESQNRTNSILLKILNAVGTRAPAPAVPAPNPTAPTTTTTPAPATPVATTAPRPAATSTTTPAPAIPPPASRPTLPPATPAPTTPSQVSGSNLTRNSAIGAGVATAATVGVGAALGVSTPVVSTPVVSTPDVSVPATATPSPTSAPAITSFSLQAFRQDDPEGAREYEEVVKTRTREIEQQLNARIPANADRLAIEMYRETNKAQAESAARREAMQQFAERIQRTQPQPQTTATTATAAAVTAAPVTTAATPVTSATAAPVTTAATPVTSATPTGFDARLLHIKAKEIIFKADKFEYSQETSAAATPVTPSVASSVGGGGVTNAPAALSAPAPSPMPSSATPSAGGGTASGAPAATPAGAANLSGLEFAGGVDQRIKSDVAEKTKSVQSAFGKKLVVTSGYRDPARNTRVGGAGGSKHLTGDAVDVQFSGNEQETINLIKVASEKGMGGIGVYRPGFLHLDTGSKRVWGPDYKATSIPQWAKPALDEHMGRPSTPAAAGGAGAAGGGETTAPIASAPASAPPAATPISQTTSSPSTPPSTSAPVATPTPSAPSSGVSVSRASVADEASTRVAPTPSTPSPGGSAPSAPPQANPSLPSIDPNNPGEVEPPDAAERYARLFNMAA